MISRLIGAIGLIAISSQAQAAETLITTASNSDFATTMTRLQGALEERQFKIFAVVDHAAGAKSVGEELPATSVIIFGNPKGGTPLIKCMQSIGIDLPMKMLVWEDETKAVKVGYTDIKTVLARHGGDACAPKVVENVGAALAALAAQATAAK
jgi:uncharacterized protein (DUF302 family)